MGVASILPVLPDMARDFAVSEATLGLLVYSFTLPGIFLAPVGGILADRLGRKSVLFPCLCLFALGGFGASWAESLPALLAWRVVQGCGAACLGVLYNTIIGDIYPQEQSRLTMMGRAATVLSLGAAIFPALGGLLGEWGWQWSLRLSLLALPLALWSFWTPLPDIQRNSNMKAYARQMLRIILHKKSMAHFALTLLAFCILYGPIITYFPLLTSVYYKASPTEIGLLFATASVGTAVASFLLGPLAKYCPPRILVCSGIGFFALSMLLLTFWSQDIHMYALALPILCYGLGQGLSYPTIISSLSSLAPAEGRGILMAVNGTVLRLAQSLAPFFCGTLFFYGNFTAVFIFGLGLTLCMLFSVYIWAQTH